MDKADRLWLTQAAFPERRGVCIFESGAQQGSLFGLGRGWLFDWVGVWKWVFMNFPGKAGAFLVKNCPS